MNCQSCGLPMMIDGDHGGGRVDNPYCRYCTNEAGNLKSKEEIREGMINLYMQSFGKTREEAEKEVDTRMAEMPAWVVSVPTAEPMVSETTPVVQPVAPAAEPVMEVPVVSPAPEVAPEPIAPVAPSAPPTEPVAPPVAPPLQPTPIVQPENTEDNTISEA